jgi:hypothetical protein
MLISPGRSDAGIVEGAQVNEALHHRLRGFNLLGAANQGGQHFDIGTGVRRGRGPVCGAFLGG